MLVVVVVVVKNHMRRRTSTSREENCPCRWRCCCTTRRTVWCGTSGITISSSLYRRHERQTTKDESDKPKHTHSQSHNRKDFFRFCGLMGRQLCDWCDGRADGGMAAGVLDGPHIERFHRASRRFCAIRSTEELMRDVKYTSHAHAGIYI